MADSPLHRLSALGQSVWLDTISRDALRNGELERMLAEDAVVGVTSNPTIFEQALAAGDAYDEQLREVLASGIEDPAEIFEALALRDIVEGCDLLRGVYDATDGLDGYVSWEVDPRLANDTERTLEQAVHLGKIVDRPNLYVKIPATKAGLPAIEDAIAAGVSINVTLIFSLTRHAEVCEAYLRGLERLVEGGGDPAKVTSVASFFVSRVDTEADKRLDAAGRPDLRGKLAIANAKLAYATYHEKFNPADARWAALAKAGARPQRCLWASTSTKDPSYRDVLYVEELIGRDTVNTMPKATVAAFQDHGVVAETLPVGLDEARQLLEQLAEAGIDYDDVVETLEREGVEKFEASFTSLLDGIEEKTRATTAA